MPDSDLGAALYETTQEVLTAAGLPAYEISNHARPGEECRHNLTYWRQGDYVGIGPGAHGRLSRPGRHGGAVDVAGTRTHRAPEIWLSRVEAAGHAEHRRDWPDRAGIVAEIFLMGLRLTEGVSRARVRAFCGDEPEALLDRAALARLVAGGFVICDPKGLRVTVAGRLRLNAVLAALLG